MRDESFGRKLSSRRGRDSDDLFPLKEQRVCPRIYTNFLVIELSSRRGRDRDDLFPLKN